jgi:hypothetical protein
MKNNNSKSYYNKYSPRLNEKCNCKDSYSVCNKSITIPNKTETFKNPSSHKEEPRFFEKCTIRESLNNCNDLSSIESSSSFFNSDDQNSSKCSNLYSISEKLEESYHHHIPSPKTPPKKKICNNEIKAIILNSGGTIEDYKVIKKWVHNGLILPK